MVLPIEETNLAGIGSDEDKALKQAAAKIDFNWEGAGQSPGLEIWRVENERTENDNPDFGIKVWPKEKYGQFHRGDSYIVMLTSKNEEEDGALEWDIYFWIGSESSQDEFGVAAYKANELDDLLGDAPIQHRETEGNESEGFLNCFPKGITYLEGGVASGFRKIEDADSDHIQRMYRVHKHGNKPARCFQVPIKCSSLNDGDAFILDVGDKIYTWFGSGVSGFEKSKSATVAHNMHQNRGGHCELICDVDDDNEEFWGYLGGKGEIQPAIDEVDEPQEEKLMYSVSNDTGSAVVKQVELSRSSLESDNVFLVDTGKKIFVWVGKESNKDEQRYAMQLVQRFLTAMGREKTTSVDRVNEGLERRCPAFAKVF